jgi:hypothetical protein
MENINRYFYDSKTCLSKRISLPNSTNTFDKYPYFCDLSFASVWGKNILLFEGNMILICCILHYA